MNFFLVNFGQVTDGRTDGQKVMHKSPPCTSTGGLNKTNPYLVAQNLNSTKYFVT